MKVFYSYCHIDEEHRNTLEKFLTSLKSDGFITEWHDRKLLPGDVWTKEIERNLEEADIVLMLITQDYLASNSCKNELEYTLSHYDTKTIIPIILKPSTWLETQFAKILALPKDAKPILSWSDPNEAWTDVYRGIKLVIQKKKEIKPRAAFLKSIEEVSFVSNSKEKVTLSDLYVWPEFRLYSLHGTEEIIPGELSVFLSNKESFSIVKGIELSGKTSLARSVFREAAIGGNHPLILNGASILKRIDFDTIAKDAFTDQYEGQFKEFMIAPKKILIVDDYHHKISPNFVEWAKKRFQNILLLIEEEEYMLYYKDDELFAEFNMLTIRGYSRTKTYSIITKWKCLDQVASNGTEEFDRTIDDLEAKVRAIINESQIVPNYPFYILSVLQAFEGFLPTDYQITTYGHCYTALITSQLIKKNVYHNDLGDCFNFLTYIAFNMFRTKAENKGQVTLEEYEKIKVNYKKDYLIKDSLISRIEESTYPIIRINSHVKFEYPYIYYFFIGKYIADKSDIKLISDLCESVYKKESANILIFTIHHTTSTVLLDEIQLHCMIAFDGHKTATLSREETDFMSSLMSELPNQLLNRHSVEQNRIEERRQQDKLESSSSEESDEFDEPTEDGTDIVEIQRSQKIIEVLGQIVKNRAGTFDRKKVKEIMIEVEELGFRLLSYFLNTLKDPDFEKWMEARLAAVERERVAERKGFDDSSRRDYVQKNIQIIGMVIIINIINKVFFSLGTDKVLTVQREISDQFSLPSYDMLAIIFFLNYHGLKTEEVKRYHKKFAESKNTWASRTLSIIVQRYMNTHNVNFQTRQQISSLLGIEYVPNRTDR